MLESRERELSFTRKYTVLQACLTAINLSFTPLMVLGAIVCFTLAGGVLDAPTAFSLMAAYAILRAPLTLFAKVTASLLEARVSIDRVADFLGAKERASSPVPALHRKSLALSHAPSLPHNTAISLADATFTWHSASIRRALHDVTLTVRRGDLVCLVGEVGSGKSAMLQALLGELHLASGRCSVEGRLAYVAQEPFLLNGSIRDNVLFHAPWDERRYRDAIASAALEPDLAALVSHDQTLVGEKGVVLSGGQRARIALARAVYADADVYLLDDPLSAVDVHVARHLYHACLLGALAKKTRVLVTHQLQFVAEATEIVVLTDGRISAHGSAAELKAQGFDIAALLSKFNPYHNAAGSAVDLSPHKQSCDSNLSTHVPHMLLGDR